MVLFRTDFDDLQETQTPFGGRIETGPGFAGFYISDRVFASGDLVHYLASREDRWTRLGIVLGATKRFWQREWRYQVLSFRAAGRGFLDSVAYLDDPDVSWVKWIKLAERTEDLSAEEYTAALAYLRGGIRGVSSVRCLVAAHGIEGRRQSAAREALAVPTPDQDVTPSAPEPEKPEPAPWNILRRGRRNIDVS